MELTQISVVFFVVVSLFTLISFFLGGRKAEAQFGRLRDQTIIFRERGVSGHSTRSMITKMGGASRVLDVIVTSKELWIKGIFPAFSFIGAKYDLTHNVPLEGILEAKDNGKSVSVGFVNKTGEKTNIELQLRDSESFLKAIDT